MIRSICIVRLSALGDVLMLVPLVRTLQAHLPGVAITWVISRPAYFLVEKMQDIEFIIVDKPNSLQDYWRFKKTMQPRHFDVLLAAQASFRANLLYFFIKATRKIGYDALRAKDGHRWFVNETIAPGHDHTLEGFLKFADKLGIAKKEVTWQLPLDDSEHAWAAEQISATDGVMLVNAAASKPERSWLVERYVEVIQYAQNTLKLRVILIGGPTDFDRQLANAILEQVTCDDLVGKTKPRQMLALISRAKVLLCPDTGPSHMGAAMGTPVVALHAVTSAQVSGPYLYRHLAVDCYPEAVTKILKKTPDTNPWGTHAHGPDTMSLVSVDAVKRKLEQALV